MIYYAKQNETKEPVGPIELDELIALLNENYLSGTDLCWQQGMSGWVNIEEFIEKELLESKQALQQRQEQQTTTLPQGDEQLQDPAQAPATNPEPQILEEEILPNKLEQVREQIKINKDAPVGEVGEIPIPRAIPPTTLSGGKTNMPTAEDYEELEQSAAIDEDAGGIGRIAWYFSMLFCVALMIAACVYLLVPYALVNSNMGSNVLEGLQKFSLPTVLPKGLSPDTALYCGLGAIALSLLIMLVSSVARLQNTGCSGWWFLALPIPLLGLYPNWLIACAPPNFRQNRKLDFACILLTVLNLLAPLALLYYSLPYQQQLQQHLDKLNVPAIEQEVGEELNSANPDQPQNEEAQPDNQPSDAL